jgi:heme/copper-type cytochrome/quinol oxidase subunit 4
VTVGSLTPSSFGEFVVLVVIDAVLAMLIFRHADRRGNRHATAWGIFTFLAVSIAIPIYFIRYWLRTRDGS